MYGLTGFSRLILYSVGGNKMVEVRRVDIISVALIVAAINAVAGLIVGIIFACMMVFTSATIFGFVEDLGGDASGGIWAIVMALAFAVCYPILFAIMGFVEGAIIAAVYNLVARFVGGIKLELSGDGLGKV
jgi:hypothetical protein